MVNRGEPFADWWIRRLCHPAMTIAHSIAATALFLVHFKLVDRSSCAAMIRMADRIDSEVLRAVLRRRRMRNL
jgi:hypothetical protein